MMKVIGIDPGGPGPDETVVREVFCGGGVQGGKMLALYGRAWTDREFRKRYWRMQAGVRREPFREWARRVEGHCRWTRIGDAAIDLAAREEMAYWRNPSRSAWIREHFREWFEGAKGGGDADREVL